MPELVKQTLETVQSHYDRGRYVDAYEAGKPLGALSAWPGAAGLVLAGRLAGQVGSARLGSALHWRAAREHPEDLRSVYFGARALWGRRGPYFGLRAMQTRGDLDQAEPWLQAEWLSMRAHLYGLFRDFDAADRDMARAEQLAPGRRWLAIERAGILELEDRYEQALEVVQACLGREPDYRPAVQSAAHLLVLTGKRDDALQLLLDAAERMQCGPLHVHLGSLYREQNDTDQARFHYERAAALYPLLDQRVGDAWLARVRSDLACACGDYATGLKLLEPIGDKEKGKFHQSVQKHLAQRAPDARRKQLDVAFIRQHHRTCAPATLAMYAQFWGRSAEHLDIADAICFDGTPYYAERNWAQQQGYITREFTVRAEIAQELIDRGIPFTLSTTETNSGHLQAVIGYDQARQVLLLRDPFYPSTGEILVSALEDAYGAYGPRGMVMVPTDRADLLEGLDLPDADLWDLYHQMQGHLEAHRRAQATPLLERAAGQAPEHFLTLTMRLSLAGYDRDTATQSEVYSALAQRYPKCQGLLLRKLGCLGEQGLRDERLDLLKELSERAESDVVFQQRYAEELADDARQAERAKCLLRRVIRRSYNHADAYVALANLRWGEQSFEEAAGMYRIAACLEDKREFYAITFFKAERYFRREPQALAFLEERFERQGTKSAGPARTLFEAHRLMGRPDLGLAVLRRGLELRPEDVQLALFTVNELSRFRHREEAQTLLSRCEGRCPEREWARAAAAIAEDLGDYPTAITHLERIVEQTPLDTGTHVRLAGLLRHTQGPAPALAHLQAVADRFPYHLGMLQAMYDELVQEDPPAANDLLRDLLDRHPGDAWAWRELGYRVVELPDGLDEARHAAEQAMAIEPHNIASLGLMGKVHLVAGQTDSAKAAFRGAIERSADYVFAVELYLDLHETLADRRAALGFILDQLTAQPVMGQGVLCYQAVAAHEIEPAELLSQLHAAHDARPDLWQTWAALVEQLIQANALDDARDLARQATERFPLNAGLWWRLAEVYRLRLEPPRQIETLRENLRIAPDHASAVHRLIMALEHDGQLDEAEQVIVQALARNPRDASLHTRAAELAWMTGKPEQAMERVQLALEYDPHLDRAWGRLSEWARRMDQMDRVYDLARQVTRDRPGEHQAWLNLAYTLDQPEHLDERLAALDRATAIRPRDGETHDARARILAEALRFDQAIAACDPPAYAGRAPFNLRGRAAWVLAQRGLTQQAVEAMRQVVAEVPGYEWGYRLLADWCEQIKDYPGQMEAADQLVSINPGSAVALGFRADCALGEIRRDRPGKTRRDKLRNQAREDLSRAIRLDPTYDFACGELLEIHFKDGDLDQARAVLDRCGPFMPAEDRLAREVALAAQHKDKAKARELFEQLCLQPTESDWCFAFACKQARPLEFVPQALFESLKNPDANPRIARELLRPSVDRRDWSAAAATLKKLRPYPAAWDQAAGYFMDQAGQFNAPAALVDTNYRANRQRYLSASIETWGCTAYALACNDNVKRLHEHFANWERREGVQPWMLCNYMNAFFNRGQITQARDMLGKILDLPPDHSYTRHLIDLAHCEAYLGNPDRARPLLDASAPEALPSDYQFNHALTLAMVTAQTAAGPGRARPAVAGHLDQAKRAEPNWKKRSGQARAYRRAVRTIGKAGNAWDRLVMLGRIAASHVRID